MKIKVIIPCWPNFKKASQSCFRNSLLKIMGEKTLEGLDQDGHRGCVVEGKGVTFTFYTSSSTIISMSRNNGVNSFSKSIKKRQVVDDCDYVLFIDADTGFELINIFDMIQANTPVIGGGYTYREGEYKGKYVAGYWYPNKPGLNESIIDSDETGIKRVDWVGAGFLLVKASVFSQINFPWFYSGVIDNGDEAVELGEDIGFCLRCKEAGIPVVAHFGLDPKLIHEQDM